MAHMYAWLPRASPEQGRNMRPVRLPARTVRTALRICPPGLGVHLPRSDPPRRNMLAFHALERPLRFVGWVFSFSLCSSVPLPLSSGRYGILRSALHTDAITTVPQARNSACTFDTERRANVTRIPNLNQLRLRKAVKSLARISSLKEPPPFARLEPFILRRATPGPMVPAWTRVSPQRCKQPSGRSPRLPFWPTQSPRPRPRPLT